MRIFFIIYYHSYLSAMYSKFSFVISYMNNQKRLKDFRYSYALNLIYVPIRRFGFSRYYQEIALIEKSIPRNFLPLAPALAGISHHKVSH